MNGPLLLVPIDVDLVNMVDDGGVGGGEFARRAAAGEGRRGELRQGLELRGRVRLVGRRFPVRFGELDEGHDLELLTPALRVGEDGIARGGESLGSRLNVVGGPERQDVGKKRKVGLRARKSVEQRKSTRQVKGHTKGEKLERESRESDARRDS